MESYDPIPDELIEKIRNMSGCPDVREIPGCPLYAVTSTGLVYSVRGRGVQSGLRKIPYPLKRQFIKGWIYYKLDTTTRKCVSHSVAKCVALAFIGEPPQPDMEAFTINGDDNDIRPDNIQWGTRSDNRKNGVEYNGGAFAWGVGLNHNKITPEIVALMRQDCEAGIPQQQIADKYGVTRRTAARAIRGEHWKQVDAPPSTTKNYNKGEGVSLAKLNPDKVRHIREKIQAGQSLSSISREYEVGATVIWCIKVGKTWKHVE